jgi:NAD(P)-dependent dehydrogenase (short-subunit alcohol dehydrogenase family)
MSVTSEPASAAGMCVAPGDDVRNDAAFPAGKTDGNADLSEQLDLRRDNSWTQKIEEISTPELAEVFAINALAPFVINSKLIPVLKNGASNERRRFVVNVSAMEGKFYRHKQPTHPHTNMAKAALNMMTRTCAADLARAHVFMTAVDTGWINDEKPTGRAVEHAQRHGFQTPLDEVDAAARILDPVLGGHEPPLNGVFLKDYAPCEW